MELQRIPTDQGEPEERRSDRCKRTHLFDKGIQIRKTPVVLQHGELLVPEHLVNFRLCLCLDVWVARHRHDERVKEGSGRLGACVEEDPAHGSVAVEILG